MQAELPNLARRASWSSIRMADVLLLVALDALGQERFLKLGEQLLVPGDQARLDQRGLGLHVAVGHLHGVVHRSDRVPDLQADIPQRIEHAVNDPGQMRQGPAAAICRVVQEHEIDVAVRIEFAPAVAADGHQRQGRKLVLDPARNLGRRSHSARSSTSSMAARAWQISSPPLPARCCILSRCVSSFKKAL